MRAQGRQRPVSRACCVRSATAGAGRNSPAPTGFPVKLPIIPTRGRFMKLSSRPIPSGWCGAATGRIRASRARCPMPGICSNCFRRGRRMGRRNTASSSPIPPISMVSRTESPSMTVNTKRVFYVKYLAHPVYTDIMAARPDVRLDRLENDSPDEVAAPVLSAAHVYQVGAARDELAPHFHVHADLLRRAPNLLIVSSNGAGFDPVDVEACTAAGVVVVNQSGGNAQSVAEHALGMLLTLSKRIIQADRALRRDANVNRNELMGTEVHGKTVGIVGLGNVGRRIAALCRGLLGMNVLAYDPYLSTSEMAERGAEKVTLDELLRRSDYVSINCPLTRESRGMIGAREFASMQKHAYFITTAR